jgi:hypothetical protein
LGGSGQDFGIALALDAHPWMPHRRFESTQRRALGLI